MVFSSIQFLFFFLPLVLLAYQIVPKVAKNGLLFVASLVFYLWGAGELVLLLLASIVFNFVCGLLIGKAVERESKAPRLMVVATVAANLALLGWFKYANFFVDQVDAIASSLGIDRLELGRITLPIGISFFTFHGLSYCVDIARGRNRALRNPIDFGLYMSLFPQLVAGPIIRYHEIADQFRERVITLDDVAEGALRFSWGLAKKVIIADAVAEIANGAFGLSAGDRSFVAAWLGTLAYTLQIYFDFSGYSDMAIGLARLFGFHFPENFNRPYSAYSITDFWRRWHITLSNWFRDYLYIPLGGNGGASSVGQRVMYRNLLIVFFTTGLWHGASWTFIIWGLYHGAIMLIERIAGWRHLDSAPRPALNRAATLLLVAVGWVMFRAPNLQTAVDIYAAMLNPFRAVSTDLVDLGLGRKNVVALALGCAVFFVPRSLVMGRFVESARHRLADPIRLAVVGLLLPYATVLVVSGTFSPFLYFQF